MSIKIDNIENPNYSQIDYNKYDDKSANNIQSEYNKSVDYIEDTFNTAVNSSGGQTIIDMVDIRSELTQVSNYSTRFLKEFVNMIKNFMKILIRKLLL